MTAQDALEILKRETAKSRRRKALVEGARRALHAELEVAEAEASAKKGVVSHAELMRRLKTVRS